MTPVVDEASVHYEGWRVAAASAVGVLCATVPFYSFSILLKPLTAEFAWSREALAGITFAAGALLLLLPSYRSRPARELAMN